MDFKEIPGFPGFKISKEGVVVGPSGKVLKYCHRDGLTSPLVNLQVNKKYTKRTVSQLLHLTWLIDSWKEDLDADEDWQVVDGFENYIITSKGKLFNTNTHNWLQLYNDKSYYFSTSLRKNGKIFTPQIHKLVGRQFLPDYKEGLQIHHINENLPFPEINYVSNLRVGTPKQNTNDMVKKGRNGSLNKYGYTGVRTGNCKSRPYYANVRVNGERIVTPSFATAKEAGEAYLALRMKLKGY